MEKITGWTAKRAGGRITILHATGKIVNVDTIVPGGIGQPAVATDKNGTQYALASH